VDVSDWIALGALAVAAVGPAAATLRGTGLREGKLDAAIEQLTGIAADHEARLRGGGLLPADVRQLEVEG
jgi:hypothetical protein